MNFLVMPLFFLSGSLFPLTNLPRALDIITKFNPLSNGIDAFRGALTGVTHFGFAIDTGVLVITSAILLWIGSALFAKIQA